MTPINILIYVVLFVVIFVLGYLVYSYYFTNTLTVSNTMWLMNSNPSITTIPSPTSSVFSYSFWMYINTWPTQTPANIFNCSNSVASLLSVDLPDTTPSLSVSIATGSRDPCSPDTNNQQLITNNLGVQRWVLVIISCVNNIVDCYLDGKLVISFQLNGSPQPSISCSNTNNAWGISFGKGDIYISNFTRTLTATNPQQAAALYANKPAGAKNWTSYSANLQINQNNQLLTNLKLF